MFSLLESLGDDEPKVLQSASTLLSMKRLVEASPWLYGEGREYPDVENPEEDDVLEM